MSGLTTPPGSLRLAVDVGGTFTDVVLLAGEARYTTKVLTTAGNPEEGVIAGIDDVLQQAGRPLSAVSQLILGTTLATNALIERKGARTALITTAGFRDLVEIGQEDRFAQYDLLLQKPQPLVARHWRFGVQERIDAAGQVLTPLDEPQVLAIAEQLREQRIESVAIVLLQSFVNPRHEQRIAELLREALPALTLTLSSEVCPEIREYERLSTACANAYVQPLIAGYLTRLEQQLGARGLKVPLFLMTSGGGITTLENGIHQPVRLVESGPAGGAILARQIGEQLQQPGILSFDMGGTTAKICFIDNYQPQISRSFEFGRAHRHQKGSGLPLRIPVIEMVEIGAGGGSVARIDSLKRIQVGPDSAGSAPGPASYGLGGELATVTDANLQRGVIDPDSFARGKVQLDRQKATAAIDQHIATPLGVTVEVAASGIAQIVVENMANAARVHGTELGKNAARYTLVAFGGAAPLQAASLARKLGIRRVVIPRSAGVGSALGFLWAPVAFQAVRSFYQPLARINRAAVDQVLAGLEQQARDIVTQAAGDTALTVQRSALLRYAGQGHEVSVALPEGELSSETVQQLAVRFATVYRELYGRSLDTVPVEAISWTVNVSTTPPPATADDVSEPTQSVSAGQRSGVRRLLDAQHQWHEVAVYQRETLPQQQRVPGPALIVEEETTTLVEAGFDAWLTPHGHLILNRHDDITEAE